ncbi:CaiB/BaiF CoA transferase family protein [Pontixanthobacter aquaemixtae]|uniref:CaiB/BaiF CoA transferase family protein n=1 Tax=Pontixanthobacter aquaemixtae TaxID=1958940 RepID=UPI002E25EA77
MKWLQKRRPTAKPDPAARNTPLAGLRVLELARVLAGPWVGQTLADLGAEVIKIESPEGDGTRQWGPPWVEREDGAREAAYYHACNRGKRSIVADFNDAGDCAGVHHLCEQADVIIENFKPGTLAQWMLDYDSVSYSNPGVIYCSITGFGQDGPRRNEPGYDFVVQAMSGMMSITGEPDGEPMKMGISISDLTCGLYSTIAVQSALLMRERTGRGQHIDMSLLDCSVSLLANQAASYFASGENPARKGNAHAQVVPYGVFEVSDGAVVLAPANDKLFKALMRVLERHDLAEDARLAANEGRIEHRDWLEAEIAREVKEWTKDALLRHCQQAGVPAGPINNLDEVFADPQIQARGMKLDLPGGLSGLRSPFRFSDAEMDVGKPSPRIGQHQDKWDFSS